MSPQDDDSQQGLVLTLLLGVVALVIAVAVGAGIHQNGKTTRMPKTVTAQVVAAPPVDTAFSIAQNAMDAASVNIENGAVTFYFASGKSDLAVGAKVALTDVVKGAQAGRKLVVSGYHDATGNPAQNEQLAMRRAVAVRDALIDSGVAAAKIELKKPEVSTASGGNAEARRVEVALQ